MTRRRTKVYNEMGEKLPVVLYHEVLFRQLDRTRVVGCRVFRKTHKHPGDELEVCIRIGLDDDVCTRSRERAAEVVRFERDEQAQRTHSTTW